MCNFELAWVGRCKKEGDPFCDEHGKEKCCACRKQATRGCCYEVGQFVCGQSLCDNCTGLPTYAPPQMGIGIIGHTHVKKEAKTGVVK